jgi:hypothetical protein
MGYHSEIIAGKTAEEKQFIHASQTAADIMLSAPESPFSIFDVTDRETERRESGIAHAIKT